MLNVKDYTYMYGISLGSFTSLGLTGKRFFPPAFCQSVRVLDVKVVIPEKGQCGRDNYFFKKKEDLRT